MSSNREQISVPLDRELRDFVERTAERETRTLAGQNPSLNRGRATARGLGRQFDRGGGMRRIEVTLKNPVYRDPERLTRQAGLGIGEFIHRSLGRIAADQNAPSGHAQRIWTNCGSYCSHSS